MTVKFQKTQTKSNEQDMIFHDYRLQRVTVWWKVTATMKNYPLQAVRAKQAVISPERNLSVIREHIH